MLHCLNRQIDWTKFDWMCSRGWVIACSNFRSFDVRLDQVLNIGLSDRGRRRLEYTHRLCIRRTHTFTNLAQLGGLHYVVAEIHVPWTILPIALTCRSPFPYHNVTAICLFHHFREGLEYKWLQANIAGNIMRNPDLHYFMFSNRWSNVIQNGVEGCRCQSFQAVACGNELVERPCIASHRTLCVCIFLHLVSSHCHCW